MSGTRPHEWGPHGLTDPEERPQQKKISKKATSSPVMGRSDRGATHFSFPSKVNILMKFMFVKFILRILVSYKFKIPKTSFKYKKTLHP